MSLLPSYIHIINTKLKHIYLSFNEKGELVIKSPKVSQKYIEALLLKKASWISHSRQKLQTKKGNYVDFSKAKTLYYLGKAYPLILQAYPKKRTNLTFDGKLFTLIYHTYNTQTFIKHIDAFYRTQAKQYIPPLVDSWSKRMNTYPQKISFRKTKRQWGSCSSQNALSFNTMMMKLPLDVIQYIIVHELSHIQHKHHQKTFWDCVERYLPQYKVQVKELKNYTT